MTEDICLSEEDEKGRIADSHSVAVKATATADGAGRGTHGHHRHHRHDHVHEVILPMRTGLHHYEVPYGLRLAGVTTGYRQGGTHLDCLLTLFTWHNQTLNSWTMIIGWLMSSWLLVWSLVNLRPQGVDLLAFLALWLCPTVHLPFTVGYHQFLCISPAELRRWRALDVAFIFIASIPLTYAMSYFVMPLPYALSLTAVTIGLSLHAWHNASALPAGAEINKKANTKYVGCVVSVYTIPLLIQAALDLWGAAGAAAADAHAVGSGRPYDPFYSAWCAASILFCFAFGGVAYVMSFPDIYLPGVFDHVGAAQQLMHIAICWCSHAIEWLFVIHMFQRKQMQLQGAAT